MYVTTEDSGDIIFLKVGSILIPTDIFTTIYGHFTEVWAMSRATSTTTLPPFYPIKFL